MAFIKKRGKQVVAGPLVANTELLTVIVFFIPYIFLHMITSNQPMDNFRRNRREHP